MIPFSPNAFSTVKKFNALEIYELRDAARGLPDSEWLLGQRLLSLIDAAEDGAAFKARHTALLEAIEYAISELRSCCFGNTDREQLIESVRDELKTAIGEDKVRK